MRKESMPMKAIRMLGRNIRDAFKSVFRNFSLSLASISCITITLIIVAVSLIASLNVDNFTKVIKQDVTVVVFLDSDATEKQVKQVKSDIERLNNIEEITFKSKDETKKEIMETDDVFKETNATWDDEDNPLKDSYLVKVEKLEDVSKTAEEIKKIDKVAVVKYGEGTVEQLVGTFNVVEKVMYSIVIALVVVTIFLIINTIKLTIFSRKREISIMRLVGASNFSIKFPFVIEGMFLGILGSIIPILGVVFGYTTFYNHFSGRLFSPLIKLIKPEPFILYISLGVLLLGIVVGMMGSYQAVRKYLKV